MDEEESFVPSRECELLRKNFSDRLNYTEEKIDKIYDMQENIYKKMDRLQWIMIIIGVGVAVGRSVDFGEIASASAITVAIPLYYAAMFSIENIFI